MRDTRSRRRKARHGLILATALVFLSVSLLLLLARIRTPPGNRDLSITAAGSEEHEAGSRSVAGVSPDADRRVSRIRYGDPEIDEAEARELIEESETILIALEGDGVSNVDRYLRHELNEIEVTEDEMQNYFVENRESFGPRTFEESRRVLRRLVQIRKLRARYAESDEG